MTPPLSAAGCGSPDAGPASRPPWLRPPPRHLLPLAAPSIVPARHLLRRWLARYLLLGRRHHQRALATLALPAAQTLPLALLPTLALPPTLPGLCWLPRRPLTSWPPACELPWISWRRLWQRPGCLRLLLPPPPADGHEKSLLQRTTSLVTGPARLSSRAEDCSSATQNAQENGVQSRGTSISEQATKQAEERRTSSAAIASSARFRAAAASSAAATGAFLLSLPPLP